MAQTKAAKAKRKRSWPNIYTRVHGSGQASYVVDIGLINGKRERHSFKTKAEAGTFAELKRTERQNQGTAALAMPQAIKVDASKASVLLIPHNVSLEEAAKYYLKHVIAYRNAPTVSQIVERMIADAEKNDRRDRTVKDLKSRLGAFAAGFPGRRMSELAVEEAEKLLKNAHDFGLLPYISLGLFAGLRSAELMRLDGKDVKFDDRAVVVGQQVAKRRSRRVLEMCDALYAWLSPLKPLDGPIVDVKQFRDNMDELRKAAKLESWPLNGLRHSFGSYHLAFYGDAIKTAQQMGHHSSDIV